MIHCEQNIKCIVCTLYSVEGKIIDFYDCCIDKHSCTEESIRKKLLDRNDECNN